MLRSGFEVIDKLSQASDVGSTSTRFRQLADDSIALVGARDRKTGSQPWVLFPFCSQILQRKEAISSEGWPLSLQGFGRPL